MINLIFRKTKAYLKKIFKFFYKESGYSIIINSIPKSGTHFAEQFFININEVKNFDYFIAQQPTFPHRVRSEKKMKSMVSNIKNAELVRAHIHYSDKINSLLFKKNILMIFIYRDPRDIAISEAYYLYSMNKFHSAHKYFKKEKTHKDRLKLSIEGINSTRIDFKNIGGRINPYIEWKTKKLDNVLALSFEEMKNDIDRVIYLIYNFLLEKEFFKNKNISLEIFSKKVKKSINPKKSHTFRKGKTEKWKSEFDSVLLDIFYKNDRNVTEKLGYKK
tara:strand:+ start:2993 stop:3817 length:825 start_codon:yes stop_codon:yes gene_type:complete